MKGLKTNIPLYICIVICRTISECLRKIVRLRYVYPPWHSSHKVYGDLEMWVCVGVEPDV